MVKTVGNMLYVSVIILFLVSCGNGDRKVTDIEQRRQKLESITKQSASDTADSTLENSEANDSSGEGDAIVATIDDASSTDNSITTDVAGDTTSDTDNTDNNNTNNNGGSENPPPQPPPVPLPTVNIQALPLDVESMESVTFYFSAESSVGIDSIECSLDFTSWSACQDSFDTTGMLNEGMHSFKVRAIDTLGNTSLVSEVKWTTKYPDIYFAKKTIYLGLNETQGLEVYGGVEPFEFATVGIGAYDASKRMFFSFSQEGTGTVRVTDKHGKVAIVNVHIVDFSKLAGLKFWLDASSFIGFSDGAIINKWQDLSGNGFIFTQSKPGVQPLYRKQGTLNKMPALQFDGVNDQLISTATLGSNTNPRTLIIVAESSKAYGHDRTEVLAQYGHLYTFNDSWGIVHVSNPAVSGGRTGIGLAVNAPSYSNSDTQLGGSIAASDETQIIVARYDGNKNEVYVNGVLAYSGPNAHATSETMALHLGTDIKGANAFSGKIAEVLGFSNAISNLDRETIDCRLALKYGIKLKNSLCDVGMLNPTIDNLLVQVKQKVSCELFGAIKPDFSVANMSLGLVDSNGMFTASSQAGSTSIDVQDIDSKTAAIKVDIVNHKVPKLWLQADSLQGFSDSQKVQLWEDSSTNGNHAYSVSSVSAPIFRSNRINGYPAIHFDGSSYLTTNMMQMTPGAMPRTLAVVIANGSATTAKASSVISYGNSFYYSQIYSLYFNTGSSSAAIGALYGGSMLEGNKAPTTKPTLLLLQYNGTVDSLYINGVLAGQKNIALATANSYSLKVGANFQGLGDYFDGDIAEVMLFDEELSDNDRKQVEAYLMSKYNL
ncbi:MAG: LamG-like jellyroll fold domain-containing protein [Bdellovibrionota bacterium]